MQVLCRNKWTNAFCWKTYNAASSKFAWHAPGSYPVGHWHHDYKLGQQHKSPAPAALKIVPALKQFYDNDKPDDLQPAERRKINSYKEATPNIVVNRGAKFSKTNVYK